MASQNVSTIPAAKRQLGDHTQPESKRVPAAKPPAALLEALSALGEVIKGLQGQADLARQQQAKAKEEVEAKAKAIAELAAITADPETVLRLNAESKARQREIGLLASHLQELEALHAEEQAKLEGHVKGVVILTTAKQQFEALRKAAEAATAELEQHTKAADFAKTRGEYGMQIVLRLTPGANSNLIKAMADLINKEFPIAAKKMVGIKVAHLGIAFKRCPAVLAPTLTAEQSAINDHLLKLNYGNATSTAALQQFLEDHVHMSPEDAEAQAPTFMQARAAAANTAAEMLTTKELAATMNPDDRAVAAARLQTCVQLAPGERVNLTEAQAIRKQLFDIAKGLNNPLLSGYMDVMTAMQSDCIFSYIQAHDATPIILPSFPWGETFE
jgi:hypothetical protein